MSFAKRIEALEVAAIKADEPKQFDVIRTIFAPDRNIVGVFRYADGVLVPIAAEGEATKQVV